MNYFNLITNRKNKRKKYNLSFFEQLFLRYLISIKELPDEYQEVEYIESTGTQYIDTGFIPNQDTKVYAKIKTTTLPSGNKTIFGSRTSASQNHYGATIATNWYTGYGSQNKNTNWIATVDTEYIIKKEKEKFILNDNETTQNITEFTCPGNMYIFAMNQLDSVIAYSPIKLYYLKIYDNDTLIRHFIPCYRKSDDEIGLYDLVEKTFYSNDGTDVFLKGDNI